MGTERLVLLWFRYIVHALFVICNAIICCVAVYALGLSESIGHPNSPSIVYLIFLGAFTLAWVIPILFLDVFLRRPITARVWVEVASFGFFWVLHLAGAAAFSAHVPKYMCTAHAAATEEHACSATNALVAFTWLCTLLLSFYLLLLISCAVYHQRHDPAVWHAPIRDFAWFSSTKLPEAPRILTTVTTSPNAGRSPTAQAPHSAPASFPAAPAPVLHAPQPRRLIPRLRAPVMSFISRTSARASTHSSAHRESTAAAPAPAPPPKDGPPRLEMLDHELLQPPARGVLPSTFYPEHVQLALRAIVYDSPTEPRAPPLPAPPPAPVRQLPAPVKASAPGPVSLPMQIRRAAPPPAQGPSDAGPSGTPRSPSPVVPPPPVPPRPNMSATTPTSATKSGPLANWPSLDIISQPLRPRKKAPPSAFPALARVESAEGGTSGAVSGLASAPAVTPASSVPPSPRGSFSSQRPSGRPSGPRSRQNSQGSAYGGVA